MTARDRFIRALCGTRASTNNSARPAAGCVGDLRLYVEDVERALRPLSGADRGLVLRACLIDGRPE